MLHAEVVTRVRFTNIFVSQQRFHSAVQELKAKNLSINDHKKKWFEVQLRRQEFAKLYDVIKVTTFVCNTENKIEVFFMLHQWMSHLFFMLRLRMSHLRYFLSQPAYFFISMYTTFDPGSGNCPVPADVWSPAKLHLQEGVE